MKEKEIETVTPAVAMPTLSFEQIKELFGMMASQQQPAMPPSTEMTEALRALTAMAQAQQASTASLNEEVKRTVGKSNAVPEHESVFNFKHGCEYCEGRKPHPADMEGHIPGGKIGHPKPPLRRATWWPRGCKVVADDCTVLEIELFNSFEKSVTARNTKWTATISPDGKSLEVNAPTFFGDDRNSLPPLVAILTELLHGARSADPENMVADLAALRQRVAELEAREAVPA